MARSPFSVQVAAVLPRASDQACAWARGCALTGMACVMQSGVEAGGDAKKEDGQALRRGDSVVSATANDTLDRIAATQGGPLSAAAVFAMSKPKKKKKKRKDADAAATPDPTAGASDAPGPAVVVPKDDGMLDADSIEYTTKWRRIKLDLEAAQKKLAMIKGELRKRERIAGGDTVCPCRGSVVRWLHRLRCP